MINQQLIDYIKQQLQQNVNKEQIKNVLMSNGWLASDVEEAFGTISSAVSQSATILAHKNGSLFFKIILVFFLIIILGGAGWFAFGYFNKSKINNQAEVLIVNEEVNQTPSEAQTMSPNTVKLVTKTAPEKQNCGSIREEIAAYLVFGPPAPPSPETANEKIAVSCTDKAMETCSPASITITGQMQSKIEILGKDVGGCIISARSVEANSVSTCKIPLNQVASYAQKAKTDNTSLSLGISAMVSLSGVSGGTFTDTQGKAFKLDCSIPKPSVDLKIGYSENTNSNAIKTDGPIKASAKAKYFNLHWENNAYTENCVATGSWSGEKSTWGDIWYSAVNDTLTFDLEKSFDEAGFVPTSDITREYKFALKCSNKSGFAYDEVGVYFDK